MKILLTAVIVLVGASAAAQAGKKSVVIGSLTTRPNALLIVNPPNNDQGVLFPQLSTGQRMSLKPASPAEDGLLVFDTNFQSYYYWSNGAWTKVSAIGKQHRYYSIDPTDFRHLAVAGSLTQQGIAVFETDNTFVTVLSDALGDKIMAPVDLPDGAVIEEMTLYYLDNDAGDIRVTFIRKKLTGDNEVIFSWQSSGAITTPRSETFSHFMGKDTIDEQNYTYRVLIDFDIDPTAIISSPAQAGQRIYGVRVKYEL